LLRPRWRFACKSLSVQAHDFEGSAKTIGVEQEVASNLPRLVREISCLWMTILDKNRERYGGENHDADH
jgi:hypothetical protein